MKWLFLGIGTVIGAAAGFTAACLLHKRARICTVTGVISHDTFQI